MRFLLFQIPSGMNSFVRFTLRKMDLGKCIYGFGREPHYFNIKKLTRSSHQAFIILAVTRAIFETRERSAKTLSRAFQ